MIDKIMEFTMGDRSVYMYQADDGMFVVSTSTPDGDTAFAMATAVDRSLALHALMREVGRMTREWELGVI